MGTQLQILYNKLETEYEVESNSWTFFSDLGELSEEDGPFVRYEFFAVSNFKSDSFKNEINERKTQILNYFNQRVQTVKSPHLLARYNHFLLYITRNNSYASKAVEYYQEVLTYYLSIHNQGFHTLHFSNILREIISLSTKYKINEGTLRNQIDSYLRDSSLSSKVKTFMLEIIGRNEHKLFMSTELLGYPQIGIDLAAKEDDTSIKERLLKTTVLLAQKTSDREPGKIANEMLGDLEYSQILPLDKNNIAISHMNENHYNNIINYYRLAGRKEKVTKAIKEFEENKKHHKYIKTQSKIPMKNAQQIYDAVDEYMENLLENTPEILILKLCFDNGSLSFPSYKTIEKSVEKQMRQSVTQQFFLSKLNDLNNNTTSVSFEKLGEHEFYRIFLQIHTLPFVVKLFKRAIDINKIGYSQTKRTLVKTAFGNNFEVNRGDSEMNYTWFSLVDIGIREFFKQFQKAVNEKQTDWRFAIDFLTPKFEAILREIIEIAGGEITRVKENGDSELKPLEDLLASPVIKEIFNEDDIFLFRHTFTKVGWNIRNNVAHGLYKSFDYNLSKAILVLLCILRLSKATIYIANSKSQS